MDHIVWWVLGVSVTIILGLITVIYNTLVGRIERLVMSTGKGLDLKVDEASYQISHQYERELFEGMRLCIKELKDENCSDHRAIMIEIRKNNK